MREPVDCNQKPLLQISAKLEFDDELSPVPAHQFECDGGNEYADDLKRVVGLLGSLGQYLLFLNSDLRGFLNLVVLINIQNVRSKPNNNISATFHYDLLSSSLCLKTLGNG